LLQSLGLNRPELRAWAMYDWANSAFVTTIMAAVLPIYYQQVAALGIPENERTAYWGYTQTVALIIIAIISPLLGAAADYLGAKKKFLAGFVSLGVFGAVLLYFAGEGDWFFASCVFIVGNIGFTGSEVFYESLLPHIASEKEIDRVSTAGYAIGYFGGGLLLAIQLAWISSPENFGIADSAEASRLSFVSVAIWWALFTVPLLRRVPEPPRRLAIGEAEEMNPFGAGWRRLASTFQDLRRHRQVFLFLLAFWLYNDGINTIIKMAAIYGAEIGIGSSDLIGAILLIQFLGVPAAFAYGALAGRIGAKNGIYLALWVYTGISVLGFFMTQAWQFWMLAVAVALVQGGSQALSRSLFATLVPAGKSSQFFAFYSVSGKFGNIIGPLVFALVSQFAGGSRMSILSLIVFFLGGMLLLKRLNVDEGRQAARAEDLELHAVE
jgi:UMF1 family MFS transporter